MKWIARHGLAWLGGRARADLVQASDVSHGSAALTGFALVLSSVVGFAGWRLWLANTGSFPVALAIAAVLLIAILFRQLTNALEQSAFAPRRAAIGLVAFLVLTPSSWLAATEVPLWFFTPRIEAHERTLAARTREHQAKAAQRLTRIERLRTAHAMRQRKLEELEPARAAAEQAIDRARDAAFRCNHTLRTWRQSMPPPPYGPQQIAYLQNIEGQAVDCARLEQTAAQVASRHEQGISRKIAAARVAAEEAGLQLEHAERSHIAALRAARELEPTASSRCLPLLDCRVQSAVRSGAIEGFKAWGMALSLLFLVLLPAVFLSLLPPDSIAQVRQVDAMDDAMFRGNMSRSARRAIRARAPVRPPATSV